MFSSQSPLCIPPLDGNGYDCFLFVRLIASWLSMIFGPYQVHTKKHPILCKQDLFSQTAPLLPADEFHQEVQVFTGLVQFTPT